MTQSKLQDFQQSQIGEIERLEMEVSIQTSKYETAVKEKHL